MIEDEPRAAAIPACPGTPTITAMATQDAPLDAFFQTGTRIGDRLLTTRSADGQLSVAVYAPDQDRWTSGPSLSLTGVDELALSQVRDDQHLVVLDEGDSTRRAGLHVLALAGDASTWTWTTLPSERMPASPMTPLLLLDGDALLVVPQGCGHRNWASSRAIALSDSHMRELAEQTVPTWWRPAEEVRLGRRLVAWSGTRALAEIAPESNCELASEPVHTTAILDLPSGAWQLVEGGPTGSDDSISLALDDELVLAFDQGERTAFWSLALAPSGTARWSELEAGVVDLFPATSGFSSLTSLRVGARGLFVRATETGTSAVVRDVEGLRILAPGPAMITLAVSVALDERRVLMLPRGKLHPEPTAYVLDVEQGSWCSLRWPAPTKYWTDEGSSYFRFAETIGGRLHLWGPDSKVDDEGQPTSGLIVTVPNER